MQQNLIENADLSQLMHIIQIFANNNKKYLSLKNMGPWILFFLTMQGLSCDYYQLEKNKYPWKYVDVLALCNNNHLLKKKEKYHKSFLQYPFYFLPQ